MAILSKTGITNGTTIEASHITQSIDAFTGEKEYDIFLSGSFNMTGSINGEPGVVNPLTASYAVSGGGTFSGSFIGDGSQLTGISASKWLGVNPITRTSNVEITGSISISDTTNIRDLVIFPQTSDPTGVPLNGQIWYRQDLEELRIYIDNTIKKFTLSGVL